MTDKKVSLKEMLHWVASWRKLCKQTYGPCRRCLKSDGITHAEHECQEAADAIRAALIRGDKLEKKLDKAVEEWKKEAKSIHDIWPKDLRRKGKSHEELSDEERAREHDLAEDIRDFGEEGK